MDNVYASYEVPALKTAGARLFKQSEELETKGQLFALYPVLLVHYNHDNTILLQRLSANQA